MNILYVTPYIPSLIRTRPYNLIRALVCLGHRVYLIATSSSREERDQANELRTWGVQVEVFPVSLWRSLFNCLRALPGHKPLQAAYAYHPEARRRLDEILQKGSIDVVQVEHLRAARLWSKAAPVPAVYDSVDCIALLFEQAAHSSPQGRSRLAARFELARTRRYEAQLITRYQHVIVTSSRDKEALEALARRYLPSHAQPAPITVITNGVDLEYFCPQSGGGPHDGRTAVFSGKMSYHANVAAVLYFARAVLPLVWAQDPQVRFRIVGKDPPPVIQKLAADGRIQVTGTVQDLRPHLGSAQVAVCPIRYAVGVQNKVLEALAMGVPVVSTSAGCAALATQAGRDVLIADNEKEMANAVLRVFSDPALAEQLSISGRQYVESNHNWQTSAQKLVEIYARVQPDPGTKATRTRTEAILHKNPEQ